MVKFLKTCLASLFVLSFSTSFCQPVIDQAVINRYDSIYRRLPKQLRKAFGSHFENMGPALVIEDHTDTLNKNGLRPMPESKIEVIDLDLKTGKPIKHKKRKIKKEIDYNVSWCAGVFDHDTLFIQIGDPFSGQMVSHLISKNTVLTEYAEFAKYDTVYKTTESDTLKNYLRIPSQTLGFRLSDDRFIVGKIIYGSAEVLSDPYYKLDTWEGNTFYHLQHRMKYYFKFRIESKDQRF